METKSDLSDYARNIIDQTGGWSHLQRSVFLKQILWINHDVQPHAVVIHANASTTRYLQKLTRLQTPFRIAGSIVVNERTENVIIISKQELLIIQRTLVLEDLIAQVQRAIELLKTTSEFKKTSFTAVLSAPENAAFKDLGLNYFFENPNSFWKVTMKRTFFGSEYLDLKGLSHYRVSATDLKLFLEFLIKRQKDLHSYSQTYH